VPELWSRSGSLRKPQFDGIDLQLLGQLVDRAFQGERPGHRTRAAPVGGFTHVEGDDARRGTEGR
jgi:hypothetical protein